MALQQPIIPNRYDTLGRLSYILYTDFKTLYGTATSDPLPYVNFCWLSRDEINATDIHNVSDDANVGYTLEFDLHYPEKFHNLHSDLCLTPIS